MKNEKSSVEGLSKVKIGCKSAPILPQQSPKDQEPASIPQHHAVATKLLPLVTGWERIFIQQLLKQKIISLAQEPKLAAIMERHAAALGESQGRRVCRHCGASARVIDRFSYCCDRSCGVVLNLDFGGEA